jgi:Smg protein
MTFRVLGPHERGRFTPEAWGHLMSLSGAGLVSSDELESLIDRALGQIEGRIALDDLRALMEGGGFIDDGLGGENVTVH